MSNRIIIVGPEEASGAKGNQLRDRRKLQALFAEESGISRLKVREILITTGVYAENSRIYHERRSVVFAMQADPSP